MSNGHKREYLTATFGGKAQLLASIIPEYGNFKTVLVA